MFGCIVMPYSVALGQSFRKALSASVVLASRVMVSLWGCWGFVFRSVVRVVAIFSASSLRQWR